jgi:hypothetical protein
MAPRPQTQCLAPSWNLATASPIRAPSMAIEPAKQVLGDLRAAERFGIATRIHYGNTPGHEPENLKRVFKEALARLKTDKVKIFYLVTADSATPIESALSAVQKLHDEGLFGGRAHVHRILGCVRAGILGCVRAGMLQALP